MQRIRWRQTWVCGFATAVLASIVPLSVARPEPVTPYESWTSPYAIGSFIVERDLDLIVARVLSVSDSNTVGHPPRVDLDVEIVLRGTVSRGHLAAVWEQPWGFRCGNETEAAKAAWERHLQSRLDGPPLGARLILAGRSGREAWASSEEIRYLYRKDLLDRIVKVVGLQDADRLAAAAAVVRRDSLEMLEDVDILATADIEVLCRQATDIVLGVVNEPLSGIDQYFDILDRLKCSSDDQAVSRLSSILGPERIRHDFGALVAHRLDIPLIHRRINLPAQYNAKDQPIRVQILFLRRGPIVPWRGCAVYWPADHANAFLPATPNNMRRVQRSLSHQASGPETHHPPEECGPIQSQFAALSDDDLKGLQIKIICLEPLNFCDRRSSLLIALTPDEKDEFDPCLLPADSYWQDYLSGSIFQSVDMNQLRRILSFLGEWSSGRPSGLPTDAEASLQVHGLIGDNYRVSEILLRADELVEVVKALQRALGSDPTSSEQLRYWGKDYGRLLEFDSE